MVGASCVACLALVGLIATFRLHPRTDSGVYFHLIRQVNLLPTQKCVYADGRGKHVRADVAAVLEVETNTDLSAPTSFCRLTYGGGKKVYLDSVAERPGVERVFIPRGFRAPPEHAVVDWYALGGEHLAEIPLQPLPLGKKVIEVAKPDPRVSASIDTTLHGDVVIGLRFHVGGRRKAQPLATIRRITYSDTEEQALPSVGSIHGTDLQFPCSYPEDLHSLDVDIEKAIPTELDRDIELPHLLISRNGDTISLRSVKPFSRTYPHFGTVTVPVQQNDSTTQRQAKLKLDFRSNVPNLHSARSVTYEWISPDPRTVGLDRVILSGQLPPLRATSNGQSSAPLKIGDIGPVTIRVKLFYRRSVPWFRAVIPVTGS